MSNKKDGVGFWKPLGVGLLVGASSLTGHSGEPIEENLSPLIAKPVSDLRVAYLPHGHEPGTGYTHTIQGVVAQVTTTSAPFVPWIDSGMTARRNTLPYYYGEGVNLCLNPPVG